MNNFKTFSIVAFIIALLLSSSSTSYAIKTYTFQGSGSEEFTGESFCQNTWSDELGEYHEECTVTNNITASGILKISDAAFKKGTAVAGGGYDFSEIISFEVFMGSGAYKYGTVDGFGLVSYGATAVTEFDKLYVDAYFTEADWPNHWFGMSPDGMFAGIQAATVRGHRQVWGEWTLVAEPVPEPSTFLLFGAGIAGISIWRRKSKTVK
jgi:hypothetical protein